MPSEPGGSVEKTVREKIEDSKTFRCGDPFSLSRIAEAAGVKAEVALPVLREMLDEGVIERKIDDRSQTGRAGPRYVRPSTTTVLLRRPWNKQLFESRQWL